MTSPLKSLSQVSVRKTGVRTYGRTSRVASVFEACSDISGLASEEWPFSGNILVKGENKYFSNQTKFEFWKQNCSRSLVKILTAASQFLKAVNKQKNISSVTWPFLTHFDTKNHHLSIYCTIRALLKSKTFRFDSNCGCVQDSVSDGFLFGTRLVYIVALDALKIL